MRKRVFIIVLDSLGIGALPDAAAYGDEGADTLDSVGASGCFDVPVLRKLGLFNIEGVKTWERVSRPAASFARLAEKSAGKDTTTGHWEIAGLITERPFPTFPGGFPKALTDAFERAAGRGILCNLPYSGTEVIEDFGEEHMKTGKLIVYTSADSVFQVAAHKDVVPLKELYAVCSKARALLTGEYAVARVIARPFDGAPGHFFRTPERHDFSLAPPRDVLPSLMSGAGFDSIGVGKIYDIFAGKGVAESIATKNNREGMKVASALLQRDFCGLALINLVDFDMLYGHRNDVDGYAEALGEFDRWLEGFTNSMREEDVLIITADHGCDPGFLSSTDHTREYVPMLIYGPGVAMGVDLKTRDSFADIAKTVLDIFGVGSALDGVSFFCSVFA